MIILRTTAVGDPQPKERPRAGKGGNIYTPQRTKDAEAAIGWAVRRDQVGWTLDGVSDFTVTLDLYARDHRKRDLDNLVKLVLDALNGIVWKDDKQVTEIHAKIVKGDRLPRTVITIERSQG